MAPDLPGYLSLHLHAHLPFVRHPEDGNRAEEGWLHRAVAFSYLPLLRTFDRLAEEEVPFRVSLSLSPPLVAMLRDELLARRCARHLGWLCEVADREVRRTRRDPALRPLAIRYREEFQDLSRLFEERYRRDLVGAFRRLEDAGRLEIATSAATHAFLPLFALYPEAVRAQVAVAVSHHRRNFGREPGGFWLPECGHYPGLGEILADQGVRYFLVDSHGIVDAAPRPRYGVFAPVLAGGRTAAFGRDPEASAAVWGEGGYPGDADYRDFYRDIGWDLGTSQVRAMLRRGGQRQNLGVKYHRGIGHGGAQAPYHPGRARQRAEGHAAQFLEDRRRQLERLSARMPGVRPVVVAPYDAELFGHWWYEGPDFLYFLLRGAARASGGPRLATPGDYLRENPQAQLATPPACSWSAGGYAAAFLDGSNDWIYRHLHKAVERMIALAGEIAEPSPLVRRALDQAARELLLAQSSDWAFLLRTGTAVDYAIRRVREHVLLFTGLYDQIRQRRIDPGGLAALEARDNLFPEMDYRVFRARG